MGKHNQVQAAKQKLQARIDDYEATCRRRSDSGKGFKKPGSMKIRSN